MYAYLGLFEFPVMLLLNFFIYKFSADVQKFYQECDPGGFSYLFLCLCFLLLQ